MTTNRFDALEEQARILEEIATTYPQESPQYATLQTAAFALIFAITDQYESFVHFVDSSQEALSKLQKENLRKMGILKAE